MKQGWEIRKLGEVCEIFNGGTPDTTVPKYWDGENLWITPKDMGKLEDIYVFDTSRKITDAGLKNSSAKLLPTNSIILSSRAPIGHLAINKKPISTNQGCKGLVPKKMVSTLYLFYFLSKSVDLLNSLGTGATFKELSGSKLATVEIPLPKIPEQQRIVAILDEAFAAIAKAKTNAEQNLKNSRELFESYLQSVFTNKGKGWENKTLNQISENLDSRRVPITHNVRKKGSVPYYGASGIVDYVEDYLFDDDLLLVSEDGANLLARTYPIAFSIKGKSWVNNHAHILKFKNLASQKFVEYYLNSIKLDDYVSGMAQPKLNQKMLNSIIIPFPSLIEQQAIIDNLNVFSEKTNKLEVIYQKRLNYLENLKKSILQKAFAGELRESDLIYKNR
jgi:type I restriction enzyme S subunit